MNNEYDVIIFGAGTAGLSAAVYALRAGLSVLILENKVQGGQILNTPQIENYPAILAISGFAFIETLFKQATELGAQVAYEQPLKVDLSKRMKTVTTDGGTYQAKTLILATGASHRKLGCPGEEELAGRGVSYCATCDGAFYRGKDVCIVGGGNTALEDALFLSNNCSSVTLIHRRDEFRAHKVTVDAVKARENITILPFYTVEEIKGDSKVEQAVLQNTKDGSQRVVNTAAVFIAVGLAPENELFRGLVQMDEAGYIVAGEDCRTSAKGVFVAGDTRTKSVRQLVTAAADGAVAAVEAAGDINQGIW